MGANPTAATLYITADSRYEVYLNGHWLGHGPVRSWTSPWPVDEYDLRGLYRPGSNVLAVLVQSIGMGTFQYLYGQPGLIAQSFWHDDRGHHTCLTDEQWRTAVHPAYAWPVTRISCQQAWEEQYDARQQPGAGDWRETGFDDSSWQPARILLAAGDGVHDRFELRDIPLLERQASEPVRVLNIEVVVPAMHTWSLNPRMYVDPADRTAGLVRSRMLLATYIHSPGGQAVQLHDPHGGRDVQWRLNGVDVPFDDHTLQKTDSGVAHVKLRAGWNCLMARFREHAHTYCPSLNIWTKQPVRFAAGPLPVPPSPGTTDRQPSPWLAIGPFTDPPGDQLDGWKQSSLVTAADVHPGATAERFEEIWQRGRLTEDDLAQPFVRHLTAEMIVPVDVFAIGSSDRVVADVRPRVDEPAALLHDNPAWTTIHPTAGADVRLLLDFGRELVGYHQFEIDAPAGAIVDNHNFEMIQRDGRYNLAEGMNNSFRYVCREGVQRYRTFVRRGFRYSWITLRGFDRPLRLRFVGALLSTYPQAGSGDFACSDELVNRIWQIGAHSVRCCSEDTYTDCPTYEQTHWVGDARNEAMVDLIVNGDARLSRHCWIQAGRSLQRSPLVESHVPSAWRSLLPNCSFLWMRWALGHYWLTGDRVFARQAMAFLQLNVQGIEKHLNAQGLFAITAWNLFDWAPMDIPANGIVTHQNCLAVLALREAAELATLIDNPGLARRWNGLADSLSAAINQHLWDQARGTYLDAIHADGQRSKIFSQQTQTAAYISGVACGTRATRCRQIIARPPKGFVTAGSPFFMYFVLEGLVRGGRGDELVQRIADYWGPQVAAGATSIWEMYHPQEQRMTRSHCHGYSAAPTFFLSSYVLGIQPLEPGFAKARIAPCPGGLTWAQGRVPTPHGIIQCHWTANRRKTSLQVDAPPDIELRLELPATGKLTVDQGQVRELSGSHQARGLTCLVARGPRVQIQIG